MLRRGVLNTTLCDKVCQWLAAGQWFSLGTPVSSTNKTNHSHLNMKKSIILLSFLFYTCTFKPVLRSHQGEVYNKHYVIKFVCDLWQVGDQGEVYNKLSHNVCYTPCPDHRPVTSHRQTLSHNVCYTPRPDHRPVTSHRQTLSHNVC
jgi:hypothetical protein